MKTLLSILLLVSIASCGSVDNSSSTPSSASPQGTGSGTGSNVATDPAAATPAATTTGAAAATLPTAGDLAFTGYIVNAFAVTVDGQSYTDLEDFYTKQVALLPKMIKAAGYDSTYSATFDAQVGFQDLWDNMEVYISPTGNQGYQGTSQVGMDGAFSITLPAAAIDATYQIRANKLITVVVTKAAEVHNICYNFSANQQSFPFTAHSQPIVLNTFSTTLTDYDCSQSSGSGLSIPENTDTAVASSTTTATATSSATATSAPAPAASAALLTIGMSKNDTLQLLGRDGLTIESTSQWCWEPSSTPDPTCAINYADTCRCSVTFDSKGLVSAETNIKAELLDVIERQEPRTS